MKCRKCSEGTIRQYGEEEFACDECGYDVS